MKNWLWENRYGLSLFLLAALILLPFLGAAPLIDPDEPVYGQTAKEMLAAGDWLSPRIYGNFWYDKPPLFYWLEMISYSILGISDYASRLPSAILGIGTIMYVYTQAKQLFNKEIAYLAGLILITSLGFVYIGKAAVTDMTLMLTLTVAMLSFYRKKYYLAYAFCGLALLAKGPIGYGFPALIMLFYIIVCRHWSLLKTMKIPQGILLAFIIGLPWYFLMYQAHGNEFLDTFIGYHNVTRFTAPEHPGQNRLYFFIPVLLAAMMPWSGAIVPALHRFWKERGPFKDVLTFCVVWAVFIFVFFSLSQTQLVTYIAPMFPPTALVIAWYTWDLQQRGKRPLVWIGTLIILGAAFAACNAIPLNEDAEFFKPVILCVSILFAFITLVPALFLYRKRWVPAFATVAACMAVFSTVAFGLSIPTLEVYLSSSDIAQELRAHYDGYSPIYIDKFIRPGVAFYSDLYGTEWNREAPEEFISIDKAYYVLPKSVYQNHSAKYSKLPGYTVISETASQIIIINHP